MSWFEQVTGFRETDYVETQGRLWLDGDRLHVPETGRSWKVGFLEIPTLSALRQRVDAEVLSEGVYAFGT